LRERVKIMIRSRNTQKNRGHFNSFQAKNHILQLRVSFKFPMNMKRRAIKDCENLDYQSPPSCSGLPFVTPSLTSYSSNSQGSGSGRSWSVSRSSRSTLLSALHESNFPQLTHWEGPTGMKVGCDPYHPKVFTSRAPRHIALNRINSRQ
jgi:hypothetical protein